MFNVKFRGIFLVKQSTDKTTQISSFVMGQTKNQIMTKRAFGEGNNNGYRKGVYSSDRNGEKIKVNEAEKD